MSPDRQWKRIPCFFCERIRETACKTGKTSLRKKMELQFRGDAFQFFFAKKLMHDPRELLAASRKCTRQSRAANPIEFLTSLYRNSSKLQKIGMRGSLRTGSAQLVCT